MGRFPDRPAVSLREASKLTWQDFHDRFMDLAREEEGRTDAITSGNALRNIDQVLRALCHYEERPAVWERDKPEQGFICLLKKPPHGVWDYDSDGLSENLFERVRLCVAEAGRALPDYQTGADPEDFWLHRAYFDLLKNNSDLLFAASNEGGIILSVCVASATFCTRLQRKALEQAEFSPVLDSDKTTQTVESKPTNGTARRTRKEVLEPLLAEKGLSVHDWATRAGVDWHTADDYLNGKTNPYPDTRGKLARALGVKVEDLPE
jgi:hypothetical protein